MNQALARAVGIAGSQSALARIVGVRQMHVWNWLNRGTKRVPGEYVIPIARATGWRVTPHELRPDLYPNAGDGVPVDVDFSEGGEA